MTAWRLRQVPPGWDATVFGAGGRFRDGDLLSRVASPSTRRSIERRLTTALFAATTDHYGSVGVSAATEFWVAAAHKFLTRSVRPFVPNSIPSEAFAKATVSDLINAAFQCEPTDQVDATLHPTWEAPFWARLSELHEDQTPWFVPQAPLGPISKPEVANEEFVDFLYFPPPDETAQSPPVVVEIDGSGHANQRDVDAARDLGLLPHIDLVRIDGPGAETALEEGGEIESRLKTSTGSPPDVDLAAALHSPACFTRLGLGVLHAVATGALQAGTTWRIALVDPLDVAGPHAPSVELLLRAIDELWNTGVVPEDIHWVSDNDEHDVVLRFEHFTPAQAPLEAISRSPQIVFRPMHIPVDPPKPPRLRSTFGPGVGTVDEASAPLMTLLKACLDHDNFREGQLEAIHRTLARKDSLVLLPTGSGKTLIYELVGAVQPWTTLVVDPLVALIDDQDRRLGEDGFDRVLGLHATSHDRNESERVLADFAANRFDFVLVTPERMQTSRFRKALTLLTNQAPIGLTVIDEAHCVSEWGHDFRPSYLRLRRTFDEYCSSRQLGRPPVLALTATASPRVLTDLVAELGLENQPDALLTADDHRRPELTFEIRRDRVTLPAVLSEMAAKPDAEEPAGIVFTATATGRNGVVAVANRIRTALQGSDVVFYSGRDPRGNESQASSGGWVELKAENARKFIDGNAQVMVSTKAFGMGIDKADIRFTTHDGIPSSIEAFAQEAGRAGRDAKESRCLLLTDITDPTHPLLDLSTALDERRQHYESLKKERGFPTDLGTQFFFHYGSFGPVEQESETARRVWARIAGPGGGQFSIKLSHREKEREETERAVLRLVRIGAVADYEIDFGAGNLSGLRGSLDVTSLDTATLDVVDNIDPGRRNAHERRLEEAPKDTPSRLLHHLEWTIHIGHEKTEASRLNALSAMVRLAASESKSDEISDTIASYLGSGQLLVGLADLAIGQDQLDTDALLALFSVTYPAAEWAGAAARQSETTPDHPAALLASAVAEMLNDEPEQERFDQLVGRAARQLRAFDVEDGDTLRIFELVRNMAFDGQRSLLPGLWRSWMDAFPNDTRMRALEERVLEQAQKGNYNAEEVDIVLARRINRVANWASERIQI